ncbi:MAG: hypothetical protein AAGM27_04930 [Cyanobacteria bacterium J06554_3]
MSVFSSEWGNVVTLLCVFSLAVDMSIFSIAIAIVLVLALVNWLTGYQLPIKGSKGRSHKSIQRDRGVSRNTRRQLLGLVGGNATVAQRLVDDVSKRNPGRTEQWCWEKAIYDIERDRRA